ncbi:hypothetical protein [Rhizobium sp. Root482]|uniref:hypothetical protein n=1 Tax=Rhizobium sp. Root482 TaxID=1736543 RepID=UPI000B1C62D1|nr:hypothetical protein [Rhizobium sp. Root482]
MHDMFQQAVNNAIAIGPTGLVQDMNLRPPTDVVGAPALLAAWASDFYAVDSKPALRQLPGTTPVPIDEVQSAFKKLDQRYGCWFRVGLIHLSISP